MEKGLLRVAVGLSKLGQVVAELHKAIDGLGFGSCYLEKVFPQKYPFSHSFDELAKEILEWTDYQLREIRLKKDLVCTEKYEQFVGFIGSTTVLEKHAHIVVDGINGERRMFELPSREFAIDMSKRYDIERHERYEAGKDANVILTVRSFDQMVESWRWLEDESE